MNQARVVAPQIWGRSLYHQVEFYPAKRYPSLRKMYTKNIEIPSYREIYSDSRTGKIYLEQKGYRLSGRPLTRYEKFARSHGFSFFYSDDETDNTSFIFSNALQCPQPLNSFAEQNGFTVRSKPEIPNEGENDGK